MESQKAFIPVMLTPFKEDGSVDFDSLTHLTEYYLQAGAKGLFANCQSSEMFELNDAEKLEVTRHVVETAGGRVPVVASGSFGETAERQAGFIKRIYDTGVQAVILITGLLADEKEPDRVLDERVFRLLDLTEDIPLGFYECPEPYKRILKPEQLGRYAATGRVIYHKDTCLDIQQVRAKLKATEGSGLKLYDAYMVHAVESLKAGSAGLSCIQGNFFPELIVWLCENYHQPRRQEEVAQVQQFLTEQMDVMHTAYPGVAKYFLQKRGIFGNTYTRRKTDVLNTSVRHNIDQLTIRYQRLLQTCSIG